MTVVGNVAVVGLGNVGTAFTDLLVERGAQISTERDLELRITGLATRRHGMVVDTAGLDPRELAAGRVPAGDPYDPTGLGDWLDRTTADVLVELTPLDLAAGQPAVDILRTALARGVHAVTANKGPLVHAYRELAALAVVRGVQLRFESATADCLPVYSLYREALPLERPHRVRGLLNSTSSVVLETIERGGTLAEGVAEAQRQGVAEADPSLDLDGYDSAVKLVAIATVLMDVDLTLADVDVVGIGALDPGEVRSAAGAGTPVRLVGTVERVGDGVRASVAPERLGPRDPFATLDATALALHFDGDLLPGLTVVGHGLTPRQTAYGVLVDVLSVLR